MAGNANMRPLLNKPHVILVPTTTIYLVPAINAWLILVPGIREEDAIWDAL